MKTTLLKQTFILPFLHHKSITICQIDQKMVSNSKLKSILWNFVKWYNGTYSPFTLATRAEYSFSETPRSILN